MNMVILLIVVVLLVLLAVVGAWLETKSRARNKRHMTAAQSVAKKDIAE